MINFIQGLLILDLITCFGKFRVCLWQTNPAQLVFTKSIVWPVPLSRSQPELQNKWDFAMLCKAVPRYLWKFWSRLSLWASSEAQEQ